MPKLNFDLKAAFHRNWPPSKQTILDYVTITVGCILLAFGQLYFIKNLHIPMGGVNGIALVMNYLWGLPVGVMNILMNLPLFFLAWRSMGRRFFCRMVVGVFVSSIFIDVMAPFVPSFQGDMLIAALYGGLVMGVGLALMYRSGGASGGMDIISKYLNVKKGMSIGTFNLASDVVIMTGSALIYGSIELALYAMITAFSSSQIIDKMVYGGDVQKSATIITSKPEEVSEVIMRELRHGVTALEGKGMYTGNVKTVLMCAVRRNEAVTLKNLLHEADPDAFMMLGNVNEVFGQGFKSHGS